MRVAITTPLPPKAHSFRQDRMALANGEFLHIGESRSPSELHVDQETQVSTTRKVGQLLVDALSRSVYAHHRVLYLSTYNAITFSSFPWLICVKFGPWYVLPLVNTVYNLNLIRQYYAEQCRRPTLCLRCLPPNSIKTRSHTKLG